MSARFPPVANASENNPAGLRLDFGAIELAQRMGFEVENKILFVDRKKV
ncbi:MAG: hypothetical protein ACE5I1_27240 [bacterium]